MFRQLSDEEAEEFRQWARDNWQPDVLPDDLWHPEVRGEWASLQGEYERRAKKLAQRR